MTGQRNAGAIANGKRKIGELLIALNISHATTWQEMISGEFEVTARLPEGHIRGTVHEDGSYLAVYETADRPVLLLHGGVRPASQWREDTQKEASANELHADALHAA